MDHSAVQQAPSTARVWAALGFAVIATAAVVSNSNAVTPTPAAPAATARIATTPPMAYELSAMVDWAHTPAATITPGETVGAYDR